MTRPPEPRRVEVPDSVARAIETHRKRAHAHAASGDLAGAASEWHILTLLAPDEPSFRNELSASRNAIAKAAGEALQTGQAALRAGDADRASAAFLRALAVDPDNQEAARALRELDRRKFTRIQADRAAKVQETTPAPRPSAAPRAAAAPAPAAPVADNGNATYDLEQRIELFRAGDTVSGVRELKAYVDAHPDDAAARQRIGNLVFERGRDLEGKGEREQALSLYEMAITLRGSAMPAWTTRIQAVKKSLSGDYYDRGTRLERSDLAAAIRALETSVRYDPTNVKAAARLAQARTAQTRLQAIEKNSTTPR